MKIAVIFDALPEGGGNYYQSLRSAMTLKKIENKNDNYEFIFISLEKISDQKLKEKKLKTIYFEKVTSSKIYEYFYKVDLFKPMLEFLKIKNPFTKFLKKNDFDIVIFLNASWLIKICDGLNFIMSSFDINFKLKNYFPEYLNDRIYKIKDEILTKSCNQAFKILVDTERSKEELEKIYNCQPEKIRIQPFSPYIVKINNLNDEELFKKFKNPNIFKRKFIFYPAQFWSHKNHKYIVEALSILSKKYNSKINIVFCGGDKGTLKYIKALAEERSLNDQIFFLKFLSESDIYLLYKKCYALVVPTYVARSTLLLYEGFYFKVPVFYSGDVLDKKLEKFVTTFDLNNYESLATKLDNSLKDELNIKDKVNAAHDYYLKNCNDEKLMENYQEILSEYKFQQSIWKK
jgi:glycosyltransferase involved in cell wall biosynthesis